jgi:hypothetical protein
MDIVAFANREKVTDYLDLLYEATQRVFPTAKKISVILEEDPEIRDDRHILFEVQDPRDDLGNYVDAVHRWNDELYKVCPSPLMCTFRLALISVI